MLAQISVIFISISQERQRVLLAQSAMMEQRAAEMQAAEDRLRIERHDLRHRLQAVAAMVEKDEKGEALRYLDDMQGVLETGRTRRYCTNTVLDAILSGYIHLAEEQDIAVELKLAIPCGKARRHLPVHPGGRMVQGADDTVTTSRPALAWCSWWAFA